MPSPRTTPVTKLVALAAEQHGLVTHAQVTSAGLSRTALSRLVRSGTWQAVRPRVFRRVAAAQTEAQLQLATCLWLGEGSVVSHRSAAKLWGLDVAPAALEVTTQSLFRGSADGVVVHRSQSLDPEDLRARRGVPVTSGARTLIDLASCVDEETLAIVVEDAWRRQVAAPDWVQRRMRHLTVRGRKGTLALSRILADCRRRKVPLESALEVRVWRLLRRSKLPLPVPGYEFRDDQGQPGRLDFAYPHHQLAIEADGFLHHGDREAFERDRVRNSRLAALGWRVMPLTWRQLDSQPARVVERIRRALAFRSELTNRPAPRALRIHQ